MATKSERFELRLDEDILARIDNWRGQQDGVPSRAEAMRRIMETGLAKASPDAITFSAGEKLMIAMLCQLTNKHLEEEEKIDAKLILSILYGGHNWALTWDKTGIPNHLFHSHVDKKEDKDFVVDVLDMWVYIESAYAILTQEYKDKIASEVDNPFGKLVRFLGFDSHSEKAFYNIAEFMIDELGSFTSLGKYPTNSEEKRDLNSHMPMVERYKRMYRVFEPIRVTLIGIKLNANQIIKILKDAYPKD